MCIFTRSNTIKMDNNETEINITFKKLRKNYIIYIQTCKKYLGRIQPSACMLIIA